MDEARLELANLRELATYYNGIGFDMLAGHFTKAADTIESLLAFITKGETNGEQNGNTGENTENAGPGNGSV